MAAQKGRDLLVQIHDGSADFADANYVTVGGFKNNDLSIEGESIEITSKDSPGFKEALSGAGNIKIGITGTGVFVDDASFRRVHEHMISQTHLQSRIIVPDFARYTGPFEVASLKVTGNENDAVTYDISLDSAGAVTIDYL